MPQVEQQIELVPVAYDLDVAGKTVRVRRSASTYRLAGGWVAHRGDHYVAQRALQGPQWVYKVGTVFPTAEDAARAALAAPRSGPGVRDGWWDDSRW